MCKILCLNIYCLNEKTTPITIEMDTTHLKLEENRFAKQLTFDVPQKQRDDAGHGKDGLNEDRKGQGPTRWSGKEYCMREFMLMEHTYKDSSRYQLRTLHCTLKKRKCYFSKRDDQKYYPETVL